MGPCDSGLGDSSTSRHRTEVRALLFSRSPTIVSIRMPWRGCKPQHMGPQPWDSKAGGWEQALRICLFTQFQGSLMLLVRDPTLRTTALASLWIRSSCVSVEDPSHPQPHNLTSLSMTGSMCKLGGSPGL